MRWRDYLAITAGLMAVSWLRTRWAPSAELITAVMVSLVMAIGVLRRIGRRRRFRRLAELSEGERSAAITDLSNADAALARLGFELTFRPEHLASIPPEVRVPYRAGSRSLNTYLFWFCVLCTGAMLVPLALGRFDEFSTGMVWGAVATITLVSGFGYRSSARELTGTVVIDRHGLAIEGTERDDCRLGWLEISWIRSVRLPADVYRGLIFGNALGNRIILDTQVPRFDEVVELAVGKLVAARGAT